jgi:hypothetical protein
MEMNMKPMDSNKLNWAENKINEAKRRLNLLLPISHRRDFDELKKAVENLDWAMIFIAEHKAEVTASLQGLYAELEIGE